MAENNSPIRNYSEGKRVSGTVWVYSGGVSATYPQDSSAIAVEVVKSVTMVDGAGHTLELTFRDLPVAAVLTTTITSSALMAKAELRQSYAVK